MFSINLNHKSLDFFGFRFLFKMEDNTLIGAIDQGTSSSRFLVFSAKDFQLITYHQVPIKLISDQAG